MTLEERRLTKCLSIAQCLQRMCHTPATPIDMSDIENAAAALIEAADALRDAEARERQAREEGYRTGWKDSFDEYCGFHPDDPDEPDPNCENALATYLASQGRQGPEKNKEKT